MKIYGMFFTALILFILSPFLPNGATIQAVVSEPLNGSYTINPDGTGDFLSLKEAADTYNNFGLTGNSTLIISSDLVETTTVEFKGSAPNSTLYKLTITTDNTVRRSVSGAINGSLVKLSGANNITFDGIVPATEANPAASLLAFTNTYATASASIRTLEAGLEGASHGTEVHLLNTDFALVQRAIAGGTVLNYLVNFLHAEGCYIHDGNLGINSTTGNNIQILNNVIANTTQYGIFVTPLNPANVTITGNVVKDISATATNVRMYGIRVYNTAGTGIWTISGNKVSNMLNQSTAGTTIDGISIDGTATIKVNRNLVSGLTNNGTSATLGLAGINILSRNTAKLEVLNDTVSMLSAGMQSIGIYVNNVNTASPALVKNCYASDITSSGTRVDGYNAVGIFISSAVNPDACTVTNIKSSTGSAVGIYSESKSLGNISNCMVSDVAGVVGIGIHVVGPANIGIFHNTVRLTSKLNDNHEATAINIGSRTVTTGTLNTIQLRNNLFSNEVSNGSAQNFVIKLQPLGALQSTLQFDNRYNVVNGNIGMKVTNVTAQTGNVYPTISAWTTYSKDNSKLFTPAFAGATDLHLADFPLDVMVPFITSVTTDFDGEIRAQCSNAAGADNDPNISTVLNGVYTIGSQSSANFNSLKQAADIYNNCGLSGHTTFKIISDLTEAATVEFKGTAPGSDTWTLTITSDNSQHRVSGNISGSLIQFTAANNITIDGGVAADTALIDGGINSTLLIFDNINTGNMAALRIQPSSPNNGKNIVIRNATFRTNSITGNSMGISISSSQSVNEVSGCYFTNAAFGIYMLDVFKGNYISNVFRTIGKYGIFNQVSTSASNMDLRITGNNINNITYAAGEAHLAGIAVLAENATGVLSVDSNIIVGIANNYLTGNAENITARGIHVNFAGNVSCSNDIITNITNAYGSHTQGMFVHTYGAGNALVDSCNINNIKGSKQVAGIYANTRSINARYNVNANSIDQVESSGLTTNYYSIGIWADGAGTVWGNKISNVISPGYNAFGIRTHWTSGNNTGYMLIANNMIRDIKAKSGYGLYADPSLLKQKIFQNTIVLNGAGSAGTQTTNIGYGITAANDFQIKNNILVNTDLTGTAQLYTGSSISAGVPVFSDNKYTTSAGIPIGTLGGITYNDLLAWNTATNDQSVSANPVFVSPADLHLTDASLTDGTLLASYLPEVISDIDDDPRTPCKNTAGADNTDMAFTVKNTSVTNSTCPGDSIVITATEVGGKAPYQYSLDGGLNFYDVTGITNNVLTIKPENPIPDGTYYLTIRDENSCEATDTSKLIINNPVQRLATITGNQTTCRDTPVTFEDLTVQEGDRDFVWNVDGGAVIDHNDSIAVTIQWATPGEKTITLSYITKDGCEVTPDTFQVSVTEFPEATFLSASPGYNTCEGESVTLEISYTGDTPWNFTYNDGNNDISIGGITTNSYYLTVKPSETTTYTIVSTSDSNGCTNLNRDSVTVAVIPAPRADFSFNVIDNNPFNYQFTDESTIASGTIISWEWDFGDGNFSSAQNPAHTYKDKGVYEVLLRIRSSYGCSSDTMKTVVITRTDSVTIADFTINNSLQCFTQNDFQFTNTSVITSPNQLVGYQWDFGDGQTSTLENPRHHYAERGTYVVELILVGTLANDTTKKTVRIYEPVVEKPADQVVCNDNQTQEVVFKGIANYYIWTGGASIGLPDGSDTARIAPFTAINNTTAPVTNTIYVVPVFNLLTNNFLCHGEPVPFRITVNPVQQPTITGDFAACSGVSFTYTTEAGMSNYDWQVTGGNIISGGSVSDNSITILWTSTAGQGNVSVNYTNTGGCPGTRTDKTVTLEPGAYITDQPVSYQGICLGESLLLKVKASEAVMNYQWYHNGFPIQGAVEPEYAVAQSKISDSGNYYVSVSNDCNTAYSDTVHVSVGIPDIIVQKWNNVLAVNCLPEENGGYQFQSFQWYKDGVLLQGETKSYLHVAPDNIDYSALYAVSATTVTGETYFTCAQALVSKNSLSIQVYPNPIQAGQQIQIAADLDDNENPEIEYILSNSMGQVVFRKIISGKQTTLDMPGASGVYLLRANSSSGYHKEFKIIVKE
ncbi:MAG: PKD domain-containing protein [Tannerella sp.]|nr:PKD domain-containing protein [Tannerella sp.]